MASFVNTGLSYERSEKRILFTVEAKVRFEEQELGHNWMFEIILMEQDPVKDDHLLTKRHYFVPENAEEEISYVEDMGWAQVDTEPGKEEVYAKLRVAPLDAPANMTAADARTTVISVDV